MATAEQYTAVAQAEAWRIRCRNETNAMKCWDGEWGFLRASEPASGRPYTIVQVKDATVPRGWTVRNLRVPAKGGELSSHTLPKITLGQKVPRPDTALESVLLSSSLVRSRNDTTSTHFRQTSSAYGSRLSLEQFGVSEFGVRATRTKLPSN